LQPKAQPKQVNQPQSQESKTPKDTQCLSSVFENHPKTQPKPKNQAPPNPKKTQSHPTGEKKLAVSFHPKKQTPQKIQTIF
jgi:hypothetical protein